MKGLRQLTGTGTWRIDIPQRELDTALYPSRIDQLDNWMKLAEESNLQLHQQRIAKDIAKQRSIWPRPAMSRRWIWAPIWAAPIPTTRTVRLNNDDGTLNAGTIGFKFNLPLYQGLQSTPRQASPI